jgi:uncharacterized lipoprotein YmbA
MLFNRSNLIGIVLIISSLILGGCLGKGTQKDTRFYLLQPISGISSGEHASMEGEGVMLAIGPVRVREYLSRPEIVTRTQENKIVVHDFHSWGEPLDRNFTAVLGFPMEKEAKFRLPDCFGCYAFRGRSRRRSFTYSALLHLGCGGK